MNRTLLPLLVFLAGCVSDGRNLRPGADEAAVRSDMGKPYEIMALPQGGEAWFYPRGFVGRQTFRAEFGSDGRLVGIEQVLDEPHFDRLVDNKTTVEEARRIIGPPNFIYTVMGGSQVWEYKYYWGAQQPWALRLGVKDGIVTGQARVSELGGPRSAQ